LIDLGHSIIG